MIKKLNPLNWLTQALDAADRAMTRLDDWSRRMDYVGGHWATA